MNPIVRQEADEELSGCDRIHIIEPLEVVDFHNFLAQSYMILTDSGGIQEEAPSLGKPVLVMRDTTERPEGIKAGTLKLVGTDEQTIYDNFKELLENKQAYDAMAHASNRTATVWRVRELRIFWRKINKRNLRAKIKFCCYFMKTAYRNECVDKQFFHL